MPPYRIDYTPTAAKQVRKLHAKLWRRVLDQISVLAGNARPPGSTKMKGHSDLYRIRIGDYRVIYSIDDRQQQVEVTLVAHRRESYRGI